MTAFLVRTALKTANRPHLYRPAFVMPVAASIALIGLYWTLERVGILAG